MNAHKSLEGLTALVTGAGRGVGKGIALCLARAGCRVAVNYNSDPSLAERTVAEIEKLEVEAFTVRADVGSRADVENMFNHVIGRFQRLDIMVNNAGVQTWGPLLELSEEDWDLVINTNLKGCFLCTQFAAKHMKESGGGVIVNIGSGSNKLAFPNLVAYTASKGGIEMFTKVAAIELGRYGIRVNCVAPGAIEIERTKLEDANYAKTWGDLTPLGRVGTPTDVGRVVVFLASKEASYISGQTLWVDGALFAKPPWPYRKPDESQ
ncbi:MAG: SDR family oxidoreductase [Blastocatellia bacterium]|nr:SDR family oxidoreductase [Blastocatellia bacterium]